MITKEERQFIEAIKFAPNIRIEFGDHSLVFNDTGGGRNKLNHDITLAVQDYFARTPRTEHE